MHTERGQGGKVRGFKPLHFSINSQGGGLDSGTQRHNVHTEPTDTTTLAAKKKKKRKIPSQTSLAREKQLHSVRLMGCNIPATSAMVLEDLYL